MPDSQPVRRWASIRCEECDREDDAEERGWRAYPVDGLARAVLVGPRVVRDLERSAAPYNDEHQPALR